MLISQLKKEEKKTGHLTRKTTFHYHEHMVEENEVELLLRSAKSSFASQVIVFFTNNKKKAVISLWIVCCSIIGMATFVLLRPSAVHPPFIVTQGSPQNNEQSSKRGKTKGTSSSFLVGATTLPSTSSAFTISAIAPESKKQKTMSPGSVLLPSGMVGSSTGVTQNTGNTPSSFTGSSSKGSPTENPFNSVTVLPTPTPVTQISIVFQGPNGQTQTYTIPDTPPVQITWGRYVNAADNYAIDYPTNWQIIKITDNGHEGLAIYPPSTTDTSQFGPHIGLGLSTYYSVPSTGQGAVYSSPIIIDNVSGTLYTQGAQGNSYVATVFPVSGGYFGLGSSVSDQTLLYVFAYMIYSLTFSPH